MDRRGFLLASVVGAASVGSGCYWQRYPKLARTHLGLLSDFATKLLRLAEDHVVVPAERWGEYTYPLDRAREFSRIVASRWPGRASIAAFDAAVAAYAELVADPTVLAREDAATRIERGRERLELRIAEARAALDAED